jgi:hypothetical protein
MNRKLLPQPHEERKTRVFEIKFPKQKQNIQTWERSGGIGFAAIQPPQEYYISDKMQVNYKVKVV